MGVTVEQKVGIKHLPIIRDIILSFTKEKNRVLMYNHHSPRASWSFLPVLVIPLVLPFVETCVICSFMSPIVYG